MGDAELVALVLGQGHAGQSVLDVARALLSDPDPQAEGLASLAQRDPTELMAVRGVGPARAAALAAAVEIGRRLAAGSGDRPRLDSAASVHRLLAPRFAGLGHEEMWVLYLDRQHGLIGRERVGQGGVDYAPAEPAQVFRGAVRRSAAGVVVAHNHPSGDPAPSDDDRRVTAALSEAGEVVGIELVDHVIVGHRRYFSFREAGALRSGAAAGKGHVRDRIPL